MPRQTIYTGTRFEDLAGYARAVVEDGWVFVSGAAGYDFSDGTISDDAAVQAHQCLATIEDALGQAGAALKDVVRLRVYLSDRAHIVPVSQVLAERFAGTRPTNTTIICTLAMPEMLVELEATARIASG